MDFTQKNLLIPILLIATMPFAHAKHITGKVERIYPTNSNIIYFQLSNKTCHASASNYFYFHRTNAAAKDWYAMLLSAGNTGKTVNIRIEDADCGQDKSKRISYIFQDF